MYVHANNTKIGKLDTQAMEELLIGYRKSMKKWIFYILSIKKTAITHSVRFFEKNQGSRSC